MNLDKLDIDAARNCLAEYSALMAKGDEDSAYERMVDANCCIQAIVLRGNIKANPFNADDESELFRSFEKEVRSLELSE